MRNELLSHVTALRRTLVAGANPDGGWGYYRGKASRLEPTAWAWLALSGSDSGEADWRSDRTRAFLEHCQGSSGLLVEEPQMPPNIAFNGLAALALRRQDGPVNGPAQRLLSALVKSKGVRLPESAAFRQDNHLQGWPWIDATFSWVEPTAWCLLALKKWRSAGADGADERIRVAEQLLIDRCCAAGGWNYGNANTFGQDLWPYVPTTALGLLAMQDRREHPAVRRSVNYFFRHRLDEGSGMALSLALVCCRIYDLQTGDLEIRLAAQSAQTGFLGNQHVMAMALYGLTGDRHGAAGFRV